MTRKQRQRQLHRRMFLTGVLVVLICVGIYSGIRRVTKTASDITAVDYSGSDYEDNDITDWTGAPPIDVELLTPNSWSRPQTRLKKVDGIVIHYTANPGSTAMQNRDYFENLPETQEAQASSHFVVGIEGEVVQCIPTSEWSYASNQRNFDTISIECCHPDDSGEFTDETYNSVVQLAGFLCKRFNRNYIKITLVRCIRPFTRRDTLNDFSLDADDEMAAGLRLLRLRQVFKVITVLHRRASRICGVVNNDAVHLFQPRLRSGPAVRRQKLHINRRSAGPVGDIVVLIIRTGIVNGRDITCRFCHTADAAVNADADHTTRTPVGRLLR